MSAGFARNAIVLGLLTAVGPFAIDMYLPALPAIAADFGADPGTVQLSLIAFFAAVSVSQLVYGPAADMFGRRAPLYFGMTLYGCAAVGCALAPNIETLIALRFVQGIGACAGMTVPRAVVRDLHTGPDAARLMSMVMLVFSVSPMLAPLAGSLFAQYVTWRAIFWFIAGLGFLSLFVVGFFLKETRPKETRLAVNWGSVFRSYGRLVLDARFLGVTFIGGFGMASFFAYLTGSSFLFIDHFGLTPTQFSAVFASNAIAFIGVAQLNSWAARRWGLDRVVLTAVSGFSTIALLLFAVTVLTGEHFYVIWGLLFVGFGCLGLVVPSTAVIAMEEHGRIAGTASALLGTLQLLTGAVVTTAVSVFADGSALPMICAIAACSVIALTLAMLTLKRGLVPVAAE